MHTNTRISKLLGYQPRLWLPLTIVSLLLAAALATFGTTADCEYTFTRGTHPIDVMGNGDGRWFYYMPDCPAGGAAQTAGEVRGELLPLGFREDTRSGPWYRFVQGGREVIVCYHDEIATTGGFINSAVIHEMPSAEPHSKDVVVWVRQAGSEPLGVAWFQAEKLLFRW